MIKEGYAIYDTEDTSYIDDDDEFVEIHSAKLFPTLTEAIEDVQNYGYPEYTEIHKVKITTEVEEIYSRKVTYELN
jgi:hypothetical protein